MASTECLIICLFGIFGGKDNNPVTALALIEVISQKARGKGRVLVRKNAHFQLALQVPDKGKIYSFNEGNYEGWSEGLRSYIDSLKDPSKWGGKPYSSRCVSSFHCASAVAQI